jgi:hypothetical protein
MATLHEIVRRLLPQGSRHGGRKAWKLCPYWPPDVFGVAATLAELSGCYSWHRPAPTSRGQYNLEARELGKQWRERLVPPRLVSGWWKQLSLSDSDISAMTPEECDAAMRLIAVTDEASEGIGFQADDPSYFQALYLAASAKSGFRPQARKLLPYVRETLGSLLPPAEACVQPKSRTAQVGCTLRSLSHHLALLPPKGVVTTHWGISVTAPQYSEHLNVLLVPFPYVLADDVFEARDPRSRSGSYFGVRQSWLPAKSAELVKFVDQLWEAAAKKGARLHAVVFPELSLSPDLASIVAKRLRRRGLEFFVAGVGPRKGGKPENFAEIHVGDDLSRQGKHHRWCLENSQLRRYRLAHVLDAARVWWEDIELPGREVNFLVFRPGATLAVLVCEDLARVDPAQVVLRSVGANLVVALLFDGPQLDSRWPARYATVLADDPGSSVLTVTSMGMARRAQPNPEVEIALWKEAGSSAKTLALPAGHHALLLSLALKNEENWTLDGRSDLGTSYRVSLEQYEPLKLEKPPMWARH